MEESSVIKKLFNRFKSLLSMGLETRPKMLEIPDCNATFR